MKIWAVYAESSNDSTSYHRGCYSSLKKAKEAVKKAEDDDRDICDFSIQPWEVNADLEEY